MNTANSNLTTQHDVVSTRVFDAPLAAVWNAWVDSELVRRWWGPTGFTSPLAKMDFREGGVSLVCMRSPDGHDFYNTWTYVEIQPGQRIEFMVNFTNQNGAKLDPAALGLPPGIPAEVRHVIVFRTLGDTSTGQATGKTELTVTEYGYATAQARDISKMGLEQCLDKMAAIFADQ